MFLLSLLLFSGLFVFPTIQHGRLMEPPSRASMWRVGFPTPRDQDDNQAYCGGFGVQHNRNGGKCGICGDPWDEFPRPHEAPGGLYANGIITKTYKQASLVPVIVDVTANHQGYFIFKLCPHNDIFRDPDQSCFDRHPLSTGRGNAVRYPIVDYVTGLRLLYVRLPVAVTCEQCILQWSYVGGNNWGDCENGTQGLGCGQQEMFRSCADIRITPHPLLSTDKVKQSDHHDDEDDELAIDFADIAAAGDDKADVERKEALLRKKKLVLEKVLVKLKELILLSQELSSQQQQQQDDRGSWNGDWDEGNDGSNDLDDLGAEEASERKSFAPLSEVGEVSPWWEKILSNRH